MKIYDISQKVFGCEVYSGDRSPMKIEDKSILKGDGYNLTSFEMCAHNGTHIDAPFHFLSNGDTVEKIPLEKTVGKAFVTEQNQDVTADTVKEIIKKASVLGADFSKRILIKGKGVLTADGATEFANAGVYLIGVQAQSVGDINAPMAVHKILLQKNVVLLEGVRLNHTKEGGYFLCAQPLLLNGADGAPCRAVLIENE